VAQSETFEIGGYYCTCRVAKGEAGWKASVVFERKSDFDAEVTQIPAICHKIKAPFESASAAMGAARTLASEAVENGSTGL